MVPMIEKDVLVVIDTFNRFRRPKAEARLVSIDNNLAVVEFTGEREKFDFYAETFKEELQSDGDKAQIEAINKNGTCKVTFFMKKEERPDTDSLESAIKMLDRYNQGVSKSGYSFED